MYGAESLGCLLDRDDERDEERIDELVLGAKAKGFRRTHERSLREADHEGHAREAVHGQKGGHHLQNLPKER